MKSTGGFVNIIGEIVSAPRIPVPSAQGEGTAAIGLPTDDLARDDLVDAMRELDLALALARRVIGILNQSLGFN